MLRYFATSRGRGFILNTPDQIRRNKQRALERVDDQPYASTWELIEACRQLTNEQARRALQTRLLPFVFMPGEIYYVAAGRGAFEHAQAHGLNVVAQADPDQLLFALQKVFGKQLLYNARYFLRDTTPAFSAARRLSFWQNVVLITVLVFVVGALWLNANQTGMAATVLFSDLFLAVISLRLLAILPKLPPKPHITNDLLDDQLPVYTVLVPLFRETAVLNQLITGLNALDYPTEKLDIKLILEASDTAMIAAMQEIPLRSHFEVIVIPDAKPQTKPKALNYALHFARGEFVVIYDAEDIAQPNQLRLAAQKFANAADDMVCLQAKLTFYNANENWLTRQFTIEYAVLFDLVLPMLASYGLPLPLGGTSNHFRMTALQKLGCWDPFNVTEDADLGIRLARFGWHADVLESVTFEEANNSLGNWMNQRARWLKGWIQTWLVHMRNPITLWRQLGPAGFIVVQLIMAGIVISTLVHPIFFVATIWAMISGSFLPAEQSLSTILVSGSGLAVLLIGYGVMLWAGWLSLGKHGLPKLWASVLAMPIYWVLISAGGWLALKQFITHPFHWNKTRHGISKLNSRR